MDQADVDSHDNGTIVRDLNGKPELHYLVVLNGSNHPNYTHNNTFYDYVSKVNVSIIFYCLLFCVYLYLYYHLYGP